MPGTMHSKVRKFIDSCKHLFGHLPKTPALVSDLYMNIKDTDNFALFHLAKLRSKSRTRFTYGPCFPYNYNQKTSSPLSQASDSSKKDKTSNRRSRIKKKANDLETKRLTRSNAKVSPNPFTCVHERLASRRNKGKLVAMYLKQERSSMARWMESKEYFTNKCRHTV